MALTASRDLPHHPDQELRLYPVAAAVVIYKGAFVGLDTAGNLNPVVDGTRFVGIAYEEINNASGAAGAMSCRVYTVGDFEHALSGAALSDVGKPVFASDDSTITFRGTLTNVYVGVCVYWKETGTIGLRIDPMRLQMKTITHAVEDLAAGADIAARAIHCFEHVHYITAVRVVNQATAAAGIDAGNTCVVTVALNAGTVATRTYNNTTTFPLANAKDDLGSPANTTTTIADILTLAVTNGATANPGPFLVEVDYV